MFSTRVIFYSILLVKFSAGTNKTANNVIPVRKSEYDRMLILRRNYWKVKTSHDLIKQNWKRMYNIDRTMQKDEIKKCRLRLQNEKDEFEVKLAKIKTETNALTRYRYFSILKNQIAEYDLHAIDFSPKMELVLPKADPFNKGAQSEEIRRQRWNHLFESRADVAEIKNLIADLALAGISSTDFSTRIARAYEVLLERLRVDDLHKVAFLETLPDFNQTIIGDPQIDKCLLILMKNYDNRASLYWQD